MIFITLILPEKLSVLLVWIPVHISQDNATPPKRHYPNKDFVIFVKPYQYILPTCRFNPTFNKYCSLNRAQDKFHKYIQGHAIRKLLRVIYKPLSENKDFNAELLK